MNADILCSNFITMSKPYQCFVIISILFNYAIAWSSLEGLGGGVNNVASASWGPGRIDIFGVANDGSVWHKVFASGGWSGWDSIGGNTQLKPSAYSIKPNWIDIVYTGTDKSLYRKTWNGNAWIDWKKSTNGGQFLSGPTITASPGDTTNLHVFAIGLDKSLYHCAINLNLNQWTNFENLGGGLVGDPAAVSWGPNRFDVFAIAGDQQLWQKTYDNGWRDWNVVSGGLFNPGVGAASKQSGNMNLFMRGLNDAIYHRSFSDGKWNEIELIGGKIKASPSATAIGSTRVDVFTVGFSDSAVYRSYWDTRTDAERERYGCFKGYCWTRCSTTFIDIISDSEWCYTTKGTSQDFKYVPCETYNTCQYNWKCAGSCTV